MLCKGLLLWRGRLLALTLGLVILLGLSDYFSKANLPIRWQSPSTSSTLYFRRGPFKTLGLPTFANAPLAEPQSCEAMIHNGTIAVQKSRLIDDDFRDVARELDGHEKVRYNPADLANPEISAEALVKRYWFHCLGSSVWLPDRRVYLLVTRVIFGDFAISFLRGRIFDEDWNHLDGYKIKWGTNNYTFPRLFDIPTPYLVDGIWFGPEDPRVVLEDDVEEAEPVIIFNMAAPMIDWKRGMFLHRPFSNDTSLLTIANVSLGRPGQEKNWSPFFIPQYASFGAGRRTANEYIHFVYDHRPLRILRCRLACGECEFMFQQTLSDDASLPHREEDDASLRGGTNLIPLPMTFPSHLRSRVGIYVAIPRTHVKTDCGPHALYRPEIMVIIRLDNAYHVSLLSLPTTFGDALIEGRPPAFDRCHHGRIMIPNSLARWDMRSNKIWVQGALNRSMVERHSSEELQTDVLTATFGLDDRTVQVVHIAGLFDFIKNTPQVKELEELSSRHYGPVDTVLQQLGSNWTNRDIVGCLVGASLDFRDAWQSGLTWDGA